MSINGTSATGVSITGVSGTASTLSSLGISTTANSSVVIGFDGAPLQRGVRNLLVGYEVAAKSIFGDGNVALGYRAGYNLAGSGNCVVGSGAAAGLVGSDGNVVVGASAGSELGNGAHSNVIVGAGAGTGRSMAAACGAVALGASATAYGTRDRPLLGGTAIGCGAQATGERSVAVGAASTAGGQGGFSVANRVRGYFSSADPGSYAVQIDADALKLANGAVLAFCTRDVTDVSAAAAAAPMDQRAVWRAGIEGSDLVLRSVRGTAVRFVDEYVPGVLNFTASHQSEWGHVSRDESLETDMERVDDSILHINVTEGRHPLAYLIVSSVGDTEGYRADESDSGEAVPRVRLCVRRADPAAFGVVAPRQQRARDASGNTDTQIGNIVFERSTTGLFQERAAGVTLLSAGEGRIWVATSGGSALVPNGALLVASGTYPGVAEAADSDVVTASTVAKITQSIEPSRCDRLTLVGCTYRF